MSLPAVSSLYSRVRENASRTSHIHFCSLTHSSNVIMGTLKLIAGLLQQASFVCVQTEVNYASTV